MRKVATLTLAGITATVGSIAATGVAYAVSGGTYSPPGQDCNYTDTDWNTPTYQTYAGCHNAQVTLESGGITEGNPNNGYNNSPTYGDHGSSNTKWVQIGVLQSPNDENSKGTNTLYSLGYPGQSGSPHAVCIAANTDGTGGRAPTGKKSEPVRKANTQKKYGCGDNKDGLGFGSTLDYYQLYCPLVAALPSFPYKCEPIPGGAYGKSSLDLDTGLQQKLTKLAKQGVILYFGMDDNSDNGEHDGEGPFSSPKTRGGTDGASDGGGIMLALTPYRVAQSGTLSQPEGLLNASLGFCADGICTSTTSEKQTVYQGCGANTGEKLKDNKCKGHARTSTRDATDYTGKQWDPYSCNSGGEQNQPANKPQPDAPANCDTSKKNPSPSGTKNGHGGMNYWRQHEVGKVTSEPGFQFYEDPDAMGSPALPVYPLPAVYAGSCGVTLGGGGVPIPNTPLTNKAHQLRINTGC